ncbi:SCP2 sterol-binding domain-containing protein [Hoyosella altamirensis]|nr:SCP2 sterol-binding domain-containing protein [Hoyosella altamirensis]
MAIPPADDEFRMHWFSLPLRYLCRDNSPNAPATSVRFGDLHDGCDVIAGNGEVEVRPCSTDLQPDATVAAPPEVLVAVFTGQLSVRVAKAEGLVIDGSIKAFNRILPKGRRHD